MADLVQTRTVAFTAALCSQHLQMYTSQPGEATIGLCTCGPVHGKFAFACMLQADAQTLGLLLLIQDILCAEERDASHPCHVVTTVRRPQTIEVSYLR